MSSDDIEDQASYKGYKDDTREDEEPAVQDELEQGVTSVSSSTSSPPHDQHSHPHPHHDELHNFHKGKHKNDKGIPLATSQHLGSSRQYWRDIILGVNDGLVSTFLLVAGVAGGGLSSTDILLTAIAGALAGAVSMCAGEYVATKSQNEVMQGEIALEKKHVDLYPEDEISELAALLEVIGIHKEDESLRNQLLEHYRSNTASLLKIMIALEFGVIAEEQRSPFWAGVTSCLLFIMGSLPSVLPFIFSGNTPKYGLIAAALITTTALLFVGSVKTWATRGNCLTASMENLVIAGCGGAFAYGVGVMFDNVLR
jgi:VIT1/CCC1 family predicted Fe2+/Mn2+ transporter